MIFDTKTNQIDVLEVLKGIRVITSSEIRDPGGDEPVKRWKNAVWDSKSGEAGYRGTTERAASTCSKCGEVGYRSNHCEQKQRNQTSRRGGKRTCKNCGETGHIAKTCKKPAKVSPANLRGTPRRRDRRNRTGGAN